MFLLILAPLILNLVDIGLYVFQRMEVENAANSGAQAMFANCSASDFNTCDKTNVNNAITSAVQSTILGNKVAWQNSGTFWTDVTKYCPDQATNSLVVQSTQCSSTTSTGDFPGTYAKITVRYPFAPAFPGVTLASGLTGNIDYTTYVRLY